MNKNEAKSNIIFITKEIHYDVEPIVDFPRTDTIT